MPKLEIVPSSPEIVLVVDDDPAIRLGLSYSLERPGRMIVACPDIESAQLMVETMPVSAVVADVRLEFGYEGLDFVRWMRASFPAVRAILMSGQATAAMAREAVARGAVALLRKPFSSSEVEELLIPPPGGRSSGAPASLVDVPSFDEILAPGSLDAVFLPIIRAGLEERSIFAFEALTRYASQSPFRNPELLFRYADRKSRLDDLQMACLARSVSEGNALARHGLLFINVHPRTLSAGEQFAERFLRIAAVGGVAAERIVVEITEQGGIEDLRSAMEAIEALRASGVRFAFDDVGIAYSHLMHIDRIRPSFLKVSQHFGSSFERDESRTKIVRNIAALAADFGCEVILEGVETLETMAAARELGITLMQGFVFGRPAKAGDLLASGLQWMAAETVDGSMRLER
ncbi:MAG TPA: EAL domain-containing response regulator [Thermoanaerobaculia bacterium]|nr:EAL domain-containing response regulator [Thermoanaerobaculia bacterium]